MSYLSFSSTQLEMYNKKEKTNATAFSDHYKKESKNIFAFM